MPKAKEITIQYQWGEVTVPAGKITPDVVEAFTNGQCHALALALHEKTQWPLAGLFRKNDYEEDEDGIPRRYESQTPSHVVVVSPDGTVDIQGLNVQCRWYSDSALIPISKDDVLEFESLDYMEPDMDAASSFVAPVLKLVASQNKGKKQIVCEKKGDYA